MKNTADKLAAIYIKMREAVKEKEEEIKIIKTQQERINQELLDLCEEQNLDSLKTPTGTVTRRVQTNFWTSDWEEMHKFIKENDAFHLLEKRIHNTSMKEFLEDNPDQMPAGLQTNRKYILSVRKPTKK
jgi:hypothetical protein|tara:strand:- start:6317 stop:6703 length:387 start_codon:yes stop_codon:yes gene_type:complete